MDAKAWRSLILAFVLLGGVGCLFLLGAPALGLTGRAGVARWLALAHGPWALPATVALFAALAFAGAPQMALIAAAAMAFGPWTGSLYSWIGTMVSALIGFELGRGFGGRLLGSFRSPRLDRFVALIGRNGFMASLIVRMVPGPPFIVVNMAAGAAQVRRADFALGTAVGILPKILLTAFAGGAVTGALKGVSLVQIGLLAVALALWAGSAWLARRWLKGREPAVVAEQIDVSVAMPPKRPASELRRAPKYRGPPVSIEEMDEAIAAGALRAPLPPGQE